MWRSATKRGTSVFQTSIRMDFGKFQLGLCRIAFISEWLFFRVRVCKAPSTGAIHYVLSIVSLKTPKTATAEVKVCEKSFHLGSPSSTEKALMTIQLKYLAYM